MEIFMESSHKFPGDNRIKILKINPVFSVFTKEDVHFKYDHRVMYKKYTTPLPSYGMWSSRKTS